MDKNRLEILDKLLIKTAENLEKNNIKTFIAKNSSDACDIVKGLLKDGDLITVGGSVSLAESKVLDIITSENYNFCDRTAFSNEEYLEKTIKSDAFFCSSNAVTENGELYNVDGNCNRISAIAYGPKNVIMIVGYNKIVKNLDEAVFRVKNVTAPSNAKRLNIDTFCNKNGHCISQSCVIGEGCDSNSRICCNYLVSAKQRHKDRIKVILVPEILGY